MQPQTYLGIPQVTDGSRCVDMGGKRKEINRFEMQNSFVVSSSRLDCTSQNTFFFWKKRTQFLYMSTLAETFKQTHCLIKREKSRLAIMFLGTEFPMRLVAQMPLLLSKLCSI